MSASASCAGWRSRCRRLAARSALTRVRLLAWAGRSCSCPSRSSSTRSAVAARVASCVTISSVAPRARASDSSTGMHSRAVVVVEIAGGLIGEQQARLVHQGARDRDALLLAPGELIDRARGARRKAHPASAARLRARAAAPRTPFNSSTRRTFSSHVERRDEVEELVDEADVRAAVERAPGSASARHLGAVDLDGAGVGAVDAADEVEERRLARAAASGDGDVARRRCAPRASDRARGARARLRGSSGELADFSTLVLAVRRPRALIVETSALGHSSAHVRTAMAPADDPA